MIYDILVVFLGYIMENDFSCDRYYVNNKMYLKY